MLSGKIKLQFVIRTLIRSTDINEERSEKKNTFEMEKRIFFMYLFFAPI